MINFPQIPLRFLLVAHKAHENSQAVAVPIARALPQFPFVSPSFCIDLLLLIFLGIISRLRKRHICFFFPCFTCYQCRWDLMVAWLLQLQEQIKQLRTLAPVLHRAAVLGLRGNVLLFWGLILKLTLPWVTPGMTGRAAHAGTVPFCSSDTHTC